MSGVGIPGLIITLLLLALIIGAVWLIIRMIKN
ncbi:hypothetical protein EDC24_0069 [Aquisalibacillus elongatus]|uniref:Uncharacterized protein n=1 Tax=Aquisalibacillus elongatus TaxID=485577 RepID=A0A3N5CB06_9BACI|nr:hypothetical protein EDC24_0069 [Aquisalibacillus elongatus]